MQLETRQKVLVVDDTVDVADVTAFTLREHHYDVAIAYSGREALVLARGSIPDAIVLDIGLPDIDGISITRLLRAYSDFSRTNIIGFSAFDNPDMRHQAERVGMDYYLVKPASPELLLTCLDPEKYPAESTLIRTSRELQFRSKDIRVRAEALSLRSRQAIDSALQLCNNPESSF